MSYRFTPQAQADIEDIALYIADDDPAAARRWVDDIEQRCSRLGDTPKIGPARERVMHDLRIFPVGRYLILYRIEEDGVLILRVVHTARDWQTAIKSDPDQPN